MLIKTNLWFARLSASWVFVGFLAAADPQAHRAPCETGSGLVAPLAPSDPAVAYGDMWELGYEDAPLGVGILRQDPWDGESWWTRIAIPLYERPASEPWGWLVSGWLVDARRGNPVAVGTTGMVETGYESMSIMVVEVGEGGWLRIRYGKPSEGRDGTGWTHTCHLEGENLRYQSYEELFRGRSDLFFRKQVRHGLRAGPNETEALLHWIPEDHDLAVLEIRGDWMRVRVTVSPACIADESDAAVTVREGWVRWRSDDKGPWVWYRTRGC
jgi:hypothetical protein